MSAPRRPGPESTPGRDLAGCVLGGVAVGVVITAALFIVFFVTYPPMLPWPTWGEMWGWVVEWWSGERTPRQR